MNDWLMYISVILMGAQYEAIPTQTQIHRRWIQHTHNQVHKGYASGVVAKELAQSMFSEVMVLGTHLSATCMITITTTTTHTHQNQGLKRTKWRRIFISLWAILTAINLYCANYFLNVIPLIFVHVDLVSSIVSFFLVRWKETAKCEGLAKWVDGWNLNRY